MKKPNKQINLALTILALTLANVGAAGHTDTDSSSKASVSPQKVMESLATFIQEVYNPSEEDCLQCNTSEPENKRPRLTTASDVATDITKMSPINSVPRLSFHKPHCIRKLNFDNLDSDKEPQLESVINESEVDSSNSSGSSDSSDSSFSDCSFDSDVTELYA